MIIRQCTLLVIGATTHFDMGSSSYFWNADKRGIKNADLSLEFLFVGEGKG
jgi:hypothetical protein